MSRIHIIEILNNWCKKFKDLVQTIGIITAIVIVFFTWENTIISKKLLEITQRQEDNKEYPILEFHIIDSLSEIKISTINEDIRIQRIRAFFPKIIFNKNDEEWIIEHPDLTLHLTVFKNRMAEIADKNIHNDFNTIVIGDFMFPVGFEINYIQYGKSKVINGLYVIEGMVQKNTYSKILLKGILFDHYSTEKEIKIELDTLGKMCKDKLFEQQN